MHRKTIIHKFETKSFQTENKPKTTKALKKNI